MKTKKQFSMTALALVAILTLAVTACNGGGDEHTHTWGEWKANADGHWKECTANDGAKTNEGIHTGNPCTACGYETPHEQLPATKTLTFVDASGVPADGGPYTVKITTSELYLNKDWDEVVASVITALNAAYQESHAMPQQQFRAVFGGDGVEIVLVDSLADNHNWEVRTARSKTLHLKTSSIASIGTSGYMIIVSSMYVGIKDEG
jgi:hypothetical protein